VITAGFTASGIAANLYRDRRIHHEPSVRQHLRAVVLVSRAPMSSSKPPCRRAWQKPGAPRLWAGDCRRQLLEPGARPICRCTSPLPFELSR
jgi:hypothetical protein